MSNENYAPTIGALIGVSTDLFISENHLRTLCTLSQQDLDIKFGSKTIRSIITELRSAAKGKNMVLKNDLEKDIFDFFPNEQVVNGEISSSITMLLGNTTKKKMLETALKLPVSQAIEQITKAVTAGYFNENLKRLIIYLTKNRYNTPLELCSYLTEDKSLVVSVMYIDLDYTYTFYTGVRSRKTGFLM